MTNSNDLSAKEDNTGLNIVAIVPAAGIGSRMQKVIPKQYLKLHDKTILEHTLNALLSYPHIYKILLAVSAEDSLIHELDIIQKPEIQLVIGGKERSDSVEAALLNVADDEWVMVHDAARPCIMHCDLDKLLSCRCEDGAILAFPVTDTIKRSNSQQEIIHTEDRSQLWHALTPQFFRSDLLKQAFVYARQNNCVVTDEASAMELLGYHPKLINGRADNIKITRPEDLALAEFYLKS